jgi:hypothetical protein
MAEITSLPVSLATALAVAALAWVSPASADPITILESSTPISTAGFNALGLGAASLGSAAPYTYGQDTVSFVGVASNEGVVRGSSPGAYAAPVTDAAGDLFGGKYLSTGNTGYINIGFATPRQALSLLWGSVDMSNQITFLDGTTIVAVITGADIDANATGSQGVGGSDYVLLDSSVKFNDIEISSGVTSFELAEIRTDRSDIPVHEPASLAVFGAGLLGFAGLRRRRAF